MISIIVPIYNVENYLAKCLDSLARQKVNEFEVLMIDDGSVDKSGIIAKSYCKDQRFRYYQTHNKGLSAARNLGIDRSCGEWLMFVDGDDWVSDSFCLKPLQVALKNDADIVIFKSYTVKNNKKQKRDVRLRDGITDAKSVVKYGVWSAWGKLYRKELFFKIRFPEGMVYEDIATIHKVLFNAKKIIIIPDYLYYYVYRINSITQNKSVKNKRDGFIAAYLRAKDLIQYGCTKETYLPTLISYALGFLIRAFPSDDIYYKKAEKIIDQTTVFPIWLNIKKCFCFMFGK